MPLLLVTLLGELDDIAIRDWSLITEMGEGLQNGKISLITEMGEGLQNGKIASPKLFAPPPTSRQGNILCAPPLHF